MPYQHINHTAAQVDKAIDSVKDLERDMPHKISDLENDSNFVDKSSVIAIVADVTRGGYFSVETHEDIDTIPKERLVDGCVCYVVEEDTEYRYDAKTETWNENSMWEEI